MILEEIKKNKGKLDIIFKKNNVILAYVYGSVAEGKENPLSDIDIAVLFSKKVKKNDYFDLRIKIAGEIDRALKIYKTEIICLNQAPSFLRHEAVYGGINIYCTNSNIKRNFEFKTLQEYEDFKYYLNIGSNTMKNQIRNGTFGKPLIFNNSKYLKKYVSSE